MWNFPYVDLLYKGVTQKFMEITMKGYEKFNKADFGNTLPGIFTDEPNLEAALGSRTSIRWTPDLYDEFQKRWGYDLKINLPSLVDETGNWVKVRHDYYTVLLEMFIDRWAKPWNKYCEENHLNWTGHYWNTAGRNQLTAWMRPHFTSTTSSPVWICWGIPIRPADWVASSEIPGPSANCTALPTREDTTGH